MKFGLKFLTILALGLTASCGSSVPGTQAAVSGDVIGAVMTTPTPSSGGSTSGMTPPPAGQNVSLIAAVADNFNTADGLSPATWAGQPSPDDTGNFRMICGAGQISYDDPIVYPRQSGKSHLHQFFGNLGADASSNYESLRSSGNSTCGDPNNPAAVNRSGYWMPAMLDGAGHVVKPEYVAIYYKRQPASAPECTRGNAVFIGTCVGIPTGLRFITGYNMVAGNMGDAHAFYYCQDGDNGSTARALSSELKNDMLSVIPLCPAGARLTLNLAGPDCWDGKNLDSADHRSHVAHGSYTWDAATNQSHYHCDAAHPYHIPQMTLIVFYQVDANFSAGRWHLSSDEMMPGLAAGSTFHTDYWEAWSPAVRETWQQYCIDGHMQCAGGDLGNGTVIKGMTVPNTQALVPIPQAP